MLWLGFLVCVSAIVFSGTKLSRYGDVIAEKSGLGRAWIGLILLASVTSLPELVTGIGSVTYAVVPDIAAGDILGSCVFNLLILAFLDVFHRRSPLSSMAHPGHILSAGFGLLLLSIVALGLFIRKPIALLSWIGPYSLIFVAVYFLAIKTIHAHEKKLVSISAEERVTELRYQNITLRTAVVHTILNACVVVLAAAFLPPIGKALARTTGLGQTFVGSIFIALATSLPEVVVSVAAVRMGAIDLAVGNLLGSNLFNILILAVDDIFFIKGPLLAFVGSNHMISALSAISMTAIVIVGLSVRSKKKRLLLAWDSLGIVLIYLTNLILLFTLSQGDR